MPKTRDLSKGLERLRTYVKGQTVQPGMFSTLDELIREAPFESNTFEQWQAYLKPGRMLKREGAQFPLKKEEIDYAFNVINKAPEQKFTKDELRELVQLYRPSMNINLASEVVTGEGGRLDVGNLLPTPRSWIDEAEDWNEFYDLRQTGPLQELQALTRVRTMNEPQYGTGYQGGERLFHHSPESRYEESVSGMQGLDYPSHFSPDTLSWSRTSTHYTVPGEPQGSVRLVEEIQSDLHSEAADKIKYDPETGKVYPYDYSPGGPTAPVRRLDITPEEQERLVTERVGYRTPESAAQLDDIQSRLRALKTARTDLTVEQREFLEERGWGMDRLPEEFMDRRMDLSQEIDRLERMERRLSRRLPDAPYKNPRDYGALELRKQLLNAVEEGNDYLALTRGADQIERYAQGMDAQSRKGMMHIYDKVYKSELEKLAKRYGAEVVDIPVNVSSAIDVRPPIMAEFGIENVEEFTEYVTDSLHETSQVADALDGLDDLRDTFKFIENKMEGNLSMMGYDPEDLASVYADIKSVRNNTENLFDDVMADKPGAVEAWNERVVTPITKVYSDLHDMYEGYEEFWAGGTGGMQEKNFPAIRLTDEVKERVRKLGVPQFQQGGLVSFLDALRKPNEGLKPGYELVVPDEVMAGMDEEDWMQLAAAQERISGQSESELMELQAMMGRLEEREKSEARLRDPEYWKDAAKFIPAYFSAMWKSLDEEGKPSWVAPMQPLRPELMIYGGMDEETWTNINDRIIEHNKKFRPGIIDETIAVRALGTEIANVFRDEDEKKEAPEYAQKALERSLQMVRGVEEEYGLEEPVGFPQHAAGALGTMLAQVPSPKSAADVVGDVLGKGARAARIPQGAITTGKTALFPVRAAAEFFDPTVAPGVKNYLMGTGFGATLGSAFEPTEAERRAMEMERKQELDHITMFIKQTWEDQSDDVKMQMLSNPDPVVGKVIWDALTPEQKMEALAIDEEREREKADAE